MDHYHVNKYQNKRMNIFFNNVILYAQFLDFYAVTDKFLLIFIIHD